LTAVGLSLAILFVSDAVGFLWSQCGKCTSAWVPISVQRFDSMWFIEIQVRLVIFARAVSVGWHGRSSGRVDFLAKRVVALGCLLFG
jgi:hypothetical protein